MPDDRSSVTMSRGKTALVSPSHECSSPDSSIGSCRIRASTACMALGLVEGPPEAGANKRSKLNELGRAMRPCHWFWCARASRQRGNLYFNKRVHSRLRYSFGGGRISVVSESTNRYPRSLRSRQLNVGTLNSQCSSDHVFPSNEGPESRPRRTVKWSHYGTQGITCASKRHL
jgi:hypothetical protein